MNKVIVLIGLFLCITSCVSQDKKTSDVSVENLKEVLSTNTVQLLDVRTPEEWQEGVIEGAITVNFFDEDFEQKASEKLKKETPVYIYCRSGGRSKKASNLLSKKGFEVYNVLGGYTAWKSNNK